MKGMIFDGESVRQILAGNKTQSCRIMKPQPIPDWIRPCVGSDGVAHGYCGSGPENGIKARCKAGETVYVKESYAIYGVFGSTTHYHYKADSHLSLDYKTPLFMPESLSRIKLQIVRVGVERVHHISLEDIKKEGIVAPKRDLMYSTWRERWIEVNGQKSWDSNPWVWVYEFVRV